MEARFNTLTDDQRLEALNCVYRKGLSTPKHELAFSADKLVYIRPFISKLQQDMNDTTSLTDIDSVRQVIDDLLIDIKDEVDASCARLSGNRTDKLAHEYGLEVMSANYNEHYYYAKKVA